MAYSSTSIIAAYAKTIHYLKNTEVKSIFIMSARAPRLLSDDLSHLMILFFGVFVKIVDSG